ncbi:hypothetical protein DSM112329_05267 [Paraconexibacter sp. AEG42_29]|uniref:Capsule synthesis protein CapA domain-containing protein n=1 Tax=Paraconexibacter sp. AEG42_29 TaxID=2997339 RepID=A0AAU7B2Y3_9ACTN
MSRRRTAVASAAAAVLALTVGTTGAAGAPAPKRAKHLSIVATGDLLIHSPIYQRAHALGGGRRYDFAPMLRLVRPYVSAADLALCHLETPMAPGAPSGYPAFNTPGGLARAIRETGWDACSTASNHSVDRGQRGVTATGRKLDAQGIEHTGSFPSAAAQRTPLIKTVKGVRVAFLSYTEMTNGIPLPNPWSVNVAKAARIIAEAKRARRAGAQVVIVNIHWGAEYRTEPSPFQKRLANALTRSSAITGVVGQHAHVVQPIRRVNGKLVVFGEGNLISNQSSPAGSQDGLIAQLDVVVDARGSRVAGIRYVPTWVRRSDFTVLPIGDALRRGLGDRAALRASYRRTVIAVGRQNGVQPVPLRLP